MKTAVITVVAIALSVGSAWAECPHPKAPNAPPAASATEQDMIAAMAAFKVYDAEVNAYGTCLEQETADKIKEGGAAMPISQIRQLKTIQTKKHNIAVAELQVKVKEFNDQVKAFKNK